MGKGFPTGVVSGLNDRNGRWPVRFRSVTLTVLIFAVAMAYMESAVVVYLQRALSITPDTLFPLQSQSVVGDLAGIEVGRELATLIMLAAVGCLVGRRGIDRLAWTAVAFGVWDVFYYAWLWVFVGWPHSPGSWDVLFLLPAPWAGPVWAPIAVDLALILGGLITGREVLAGRIPRVTRIRGSGAVAGGVLVIGSFMANAPALLTGGVPGWFPWPLFLAGMAVAGWGAAASLRSGRVAGAAAE